MVFERAESAVGVYDQHLQTFSLEGESEGDFEVEIVIGLHQMAQTLFSKTGFWYWLK